MGDFSEPSETVCENADDLTCEDQGLITCPDGDCAGDINYCTENCEEGYVEDCHFWSRPDCCPESWIGDGIEDCSDGEWCNLSCYDCDGGDCPEYDPGCTGEDLYCGDGYCTGDETYEACPEDCNAPGECDYGYIPDCSGDGDCCPEDWLPGFPYDICHAYCEVYCYYPNIDCLELYCGNSECAGPETVENCPEDCTSSEACDDCLYDYTHYGSECCDTAWEEYGIDCATLESNYSWDCEGCMCPGDIAICEEQDFVMCDDYSCAISFEACNLSCEEQGLFECWDNSCAQIESDCPPYCWEEPGYIQDCSSTNCYPESWIGDGWVCNDGTDNNGADFTCYDCDGGDCPPNTPGCEETEDCCSPGDYNCDYNIDVLDIVAIVNCILEDADCPCADIDDDGAVNVLDIVQLVNVILEG